MNPSDAQLIKILIVDDEAGVRELLKDALKLAGFETQVANDGMSALTVLRSYTPDIMIIDINMPLMDGFELVERLRKERKQRSSSDVKRTSRSRRYHPRINARSR
jgi:DNA-binding response OmpR family regulator